MAEPSLPLEEPLPQGSAGVVAPPLHNSRPWPFRPTYDALGMHLYAAPMRERRAALSACAVRGCG